MKKGFIAISSLLVVSAVTLAIAMSVSLLGVTSANTALGYQKGQEALKYGESCIDETLFRLRDDGNFTGVSLTLPYGSCIATVSATGDQRTITSTGIISGPPVFMKLITAVATRVGKSITINSWIETK